MTLFIISLTALHILSDITFKEHQKLKLQKQEQFVSSKVPAFVFDELKCLAENIYHEARSESVEEQMAVANVTMNRVFHKNYPNTVCEVVYQKSQFSWTLRNVSYKKIYNKSAYNKSLQIAKTVYTDTVKDNTNGSTHYYAHRLIPAPKWAKPEYFVVMLTAHTYFRIN